MIQAWLRIYIASSYSHYAVNSHFLCPTHKRANLCSCAQLDSGSGKWEAALLWRKNRMHHFHLYGMVRRHGQSCVAETDLSTYNERAATWSVGIHRQCMRSTLCHHYGKKKKKKWLPHLIKDTTSCLIYIPKLVNWEMWVDINGLLEKIVRSGG